jgi:hypothetical protein
MLSFAVVKFLEGRKLMFLGKPKKPHTQKLVTLGSGLGKAEYKAE